MLIRNKILVLVLCLVILATSAIAYLSFQHTSDVARQATEKSVLSTLRTTTTKLLDSYQVMYGDATLLSNTPAIRNLLISLETNRSLLSSANPLRINTEALFRSLLLSRQHYTQLRIINVQDGGQEVVRLNRGSEGIEIVGLDELQNKSGEPYYQDALRLRPESVYISNITLNREKGQIDPALIPTIRMVLPLFQATKLTALLVINADFGQMVQESFREVATDGNIYIDNRLGDYLKLDSQGILSKHFRTPDNSPTLPDLITAFQEHSEDENTAYLKESAGFWIRQNLSFGGPYAFVDVYEEIPNSIVFAPVWKAQRELLWLSATLLIISVVISYLVSRQFTRRLQLMTSSIENLHGRDHTADLYLPEDNRDEIGTLARAFADLYEDLTESEQNANAVIENTLDGIVACDLSGNIIHYNAACSRIFGYQPEEVANLSLSALLIRRKVEEDGQIHLQELNVAEHFLSGLVKEMIGVRKDGSRIPMEVSISEVRLSDQRYFVCIIRDISQQKRHEQEIKGLIAGLERSNEELENFAHIASHDLKEPLRAISNHTVFLEEDYADKFDEDGRQRLARIRTLINKMNRLISDLLYYSRITKIQDAMVPCNIGEIARDAVSLLNEMIEERHATVTIDDDFPTIICEQVRVTEIFRNLVANALKYASVDQIDIHVGFKEGVPPTFFVKDNGIGIAQEFHKEIFRIFKRLQSSESEEGSGSGLSIAKRIVENHGGKIWIDSAENEGTTVLFTLESQPTGSAQYDEQETAAYHR